MYSTNLPPKRYVSDLLKKRSHNLFLEQDGQEEDRPNSSLEDDSLEWKDCTLAHQSCSPIRKPWSVLTISIVSTHTLIEAGGDKHKRLKEEVSHDVE